MLYRRTTSTRTNMTWAWATRLQQARLTAIVIVHRTMRHRWVTAVRRVAVVRVVARRIQRRRQQLRRQRPRHLWHRLHLQWLPLPGRIWLSEVVSLRRRRRSCKSIAIIFVPISSAARGQSILTLSLNSNSYFTTRSC